ncbi:MAG: tRNA adenosine(34) deaminase TadA [Thermodesulfovibrionales bacterium]|nr:tRNA adenosine(34) deaminase TadA [Thermodesulfovibrionales bacterium]
MATDEDFMKIALFEAKLAYQAGEVPVGAVIVVENKVISKAHNKKELLKDPTAHAEILAIREASAYFKNWRLSNATLYVTKEPCPMCAGAIISARIKRLVYGCSDPKSGAVDTLYEMLSDKRLNHQVDVISGVLKEECEMILKSFFRGIREIKEVRSDIFKV